MTTRHLRGFFAPPGAVTISSAALVLARAFAEQVKATAPKVPQIVAFDWADSRAIRRPKGGPWVQLGAGVDLAAYDLDDVPRDMIHEIDGFRFAVRISRHIYEVSARRLVDADNTTASGLILR